MASQDSQSQSPVQGHVIIDLETSLDSDPCQEDSSATLSVWRNRLQLCVLALVQLQIAMHTFIITGTRPDVETEYNLTSKQYFAFYAVFPLVYLFMVVPFGLFADRHNKKLIICGGITMQVLATLLSSFVPGQHFWLFLVFSIISSIGEASYASVITSMAIKLVPEEKQIFVLAFLQVVSTIGRGLGYWIAYGLLTYKGLHWHWTGKVSAALSAIALLVVVKYLKKPPEVKDPEPLHLCGTNNANAACRIRTLFFGIIGSAFIPFISEGVVTWSYTYMTHAMTVMEKDKVCLTTACQLDDKLYTELLTEMSRIVGVVIGTMISQRCEKFGSRADPFVCMLCLLISVPFLLALSFYAESSFAAGCILVFFIVMILGITSVIAANIRINVASSKLQTCSSAWELFAADTLGYISTIILYVVEHQAMEKESILPPTEIAFRSQEHILMSYPFMAILGCLFYLAVMIVIGRDCQEEES